MKPGRKPPVRHPETTMKSQPSAVTLAAKKDRMERFVAQYMIDMNAEQAVRRCGFRVKGTRTLGARLLRWPTVRAEIQKRKSEQLRKVGLTAEKVLESIRRVLDADVRNLFDEKGNYIPIRQLSDEDASLIDGFEIIIKNAKAGDGHTDLVHKVKTVDRARYVEMAAKHFKLLTEVHEHYDMTGVETRLRAARARIVKINGERKLLPAAPVTIQ